MNTEAASTAFLLMAIIPGLFLACLLVPLLSRRGLWFRTVPTRDQWLVLGLFAFTLTLAVFVVRKAEFAAFMGLSGAAVLFQYWGPKRWHRLRIFGAYFLPLRVKAWRPLGEGVEVSLGWGARILVPGQSANQAFLADLERLYPLERRDLSSQ